MSGMSLMCCTPAFILRIENVRPIIEMRKSATRMGGIELRLKTSETLGYCSCDNSLDHKVGGIICAVRNDRLTSNDSLSITNRKCGK